MGKEKDKDKKDKEKREKEKEKDKEKEKEKKDKKEKDKNKKDKDKEKKEKDKTTLNQEWKLSISKNLDSIIHAYDKITNKFRDIDNYILKDAKSKEDFIGKVKKNIEDLTDAFQQIFLTFLNSIE